MTQDKSLVYEVQHDWGNREYIEIMTGGIQKMADFLISFELSCRYKLSQINEKLTYLEKKMDYLETYILGTNKECMNTSTI
ncbi:unnamed protein product [Gordionus sp. m RMFG-2023]